MKKILVSLVLVFALFFSFGNLQVNAEISSQQEKRIEDFLNNYFNSYEKKYGKQKTINFIKKLLPKIREYYLKKKNNEKLEIFRSIFNKTEYILDKKVIEYYYDLLEQGRFLEANNLVYENTVDCLKIINIIKGHIVNIDISNFKAERETTYSYILKIKFLDTGKEKTYQVFTNVGNYSGFSETAKKHAGLIRINSFRELDIK